MNSANDFLNRLLENPLVKAEYDKIAGEYVITKTTFHDCHVELVQVKGFKNPIFFRIGSKDLEDFYRPVDVAWYAENSMEKASWTVENLVFNRASKRPVVVLVARQFGYIDVYLHVVEHDEALHGKLYN